LVNRSNLYTYAQVIDAQWRIVVWMSDKTLSGAGKVAKAFELWKNIASQCQKSWITTLTFDRNGYLYHGRVKALADGAREGGLMF
jgi:large subunit ribosomal protein L18